jgi:hypothetical protein
MFATISELQGDSRRMASAFNQSTEYWQISQDVSKDDQNWRINECRRTAFPGRSKAVTFERTSDRC